MQYEWKDRIKKVYPPLREQDVQSLEKELGTTLPADYRRFLEFSNGANFAGMPTFRYSVPGSDGSQIEHEGNLTILCGIDPTMEELQVKSLRSCQEWYGFNEEVPRKYLAIGHPAHHAVVCISTKGEDRGAVYLWEPAELGVPAAYPEEYVFRIADSFDQFLDQLEISEHRNS